MSPTAFFKIQIAIAKDGAKTKTRVETFQGTLPASYLSSLELGCQAFDRLKENLRISPIDDFKYAKSGSTAFKQGIASFVSQPQGEQLGPTKLRSLMQKKLFIGFVLPVGQISLN
ncbi:MAG: hypothetical protein BWY75_02488 [bacterium ADurb.Bin425]|nr:MAG: hypothetical protein BWY75_02488 [bacterium ADurb.Bin425]